MLGSAKVIRIIKNIVESIAQARDLALLPHYYREIVSLYFPIYIYIYTKIIHKTNIS